MPTAPSANLAVGEAGSIHRASASSASAVTVPTVPTPTAGSGEFGIGRPETPPWSTYSLP
jgi:hypothetical protein